MPELKSLTDFYNPTQTMQMGMQYLQGQQQLANQTAATEQQGRNLDIDNLQKALTAANPMESYPIAKQLHEKLGLPVPPVNQYYANPQMFNELTKHDPASPEYAAAFDTLARTDPRSRKAVQEVYEHQAGFRGARSVLGLAGVPPDNDVASLLQQSPALQGKFGEAIAQSPLQMAKQKDIEARTREHEATSANVNVQLGALVPLMATAGLQLERAAPHIDLMDTFQQEYDKNVRGQGIMTVSNVMKEKIALNPDLQAFEDRRKESIPKLQQAIQQLEDQQSQMEARAELIARGAAPLKDGESLEQMTGQIDASMHTLKFYKASLALAKKPSKDNFAALRAVKAGLDDTVSSLTDRKRSSQESLELRRSGLDETMKEHTLTRERVDRIGNAQVAWEESGSDPKTAWKYAKQFKVKVSEVKEGAKDPNAPGVVVKMPATTEEAGKFAMIDNASKSIDAVSKAITKSDGSIDRAKVFASAFNVPFTEGRNISSMMEDAISAKLRAETGAAANASEVESIKKRFDLSTLDTDSVVKDKLSRLKRFMDETRVIRDSTGKIREVAASAEAKQAPAAKGGALTPVEQKELDELRKKHGR